MENQNHETAQLMQEIVRLRQAYKELLNEAKEVMEELNAANDTLQKTIHRHQKNLQEKNNRIVYANGMLLECKRTFERLYDEKIDYRSLGNDAFYHDIKRFLDGLH